MSGFGVIDIAIGLIFVYLLLALICTAVNEFIAGMLGRRAANLKVGIQKLLESNATMRGPDSLIEKFYNHPLIKSLNEDDRHPSYIPPKTFALALIDLLAPMAAGTRNADVLQTLQNQINQIPYLQRTLGPMLVAADGDLKKLQQEIEQWFDSAMDRVSGWYKQKTQWISLMIAVVTVAVLNADTIRITRALSNSPTLRETLVARSRELTTKQGTSAASAQPPTSKEIADDIAKLDQLGIPLWWDRPPACFPEILSSVVGILISSIAVSLGAPFWFDTLNRIITIRGAGRSPREARKGSETQPAT
jgi:hypothetical protein